MKYPHLAAKLYNAPLMVHPDKAAVIEQVFRAHLMGEAKPEARTEDFARAEATLGSVKFQPRSDKPYPITEGGVAIIQVVGTLVQRGDSLDAMSGLIGYNRIERSLAAALADGAVKGILLEIDSPGGEANGCFDLAKRIVDARNEKPIWACANEQAFSAAYALACAAKRLTVPPTGLLGSIGVIALHVDQSKRDSQQGYSYTAVFAGARKNDFTSHEPLSKTAEGILQTEVDRLYGIFVAHVARARGIDEKVVRATQAGLLDPEVARAGGFVDEIQSFGDTVAALEAVVNRFSNSTAIFQSRADQSTSRAVAAHQPKETTMSDQNKPAATTEKPAETQPTTAASVDATKIAADARAAERARVSAILGCEEAKGREKLAQHLVSNTDMNLEDAKKTLAASAAQSGTGFNGAMNALGNPKVGADTGEDIDTGKRRVDSVAIYDSRAKAAAERA